MSQHPVQRPGQAASKEEEVVAVEQVQVRSGAGGILLWSYKYMYCVSARARAAAAAARGGAPGPAWGSAASATAGEAAADQWERGSWSRDPSTAADWLLCCGSPTDHEQCGGGACPLEGGVSSPGEVTVALGGWRDDWLQTVTILHPDTGQEVRIDTVV